jgi:hypothetical protein
MAARTVAAKKIELVGTVDKETTGTFKFAFPARVVEVEGEKFSIDPPVTTLYVSKGALTGLTADSKIKITVELA